MAIKITQKAADKVVELMKDAGLDPGSAFLRMGVQGGGCSGFSYSLEFDTATHDTDKVFVHVKSEAHETLGQTWGLFEDGKCPCGTPTVMPFRVVSDAKSYLYLNGVTIDFVTEGLTGGFTFINPNAKASCGCGHSFST